MIFFFDFSGDIFVIIDFIYNASFNVQLHVRNLSLSLFLSLSLSLSHTHTHTHNCLAFLLSWVTLMKFLFCIFSGVRSVILPTLNHQRAVIAIRAYFKSNKSIIYSPREVSEREALFTFYDGIRLGCSVQELCQFSKG